MQGKDGIDGWSKSAGIVVGEVECNRRWTGRGSQAVSSKWRCEKSRGLWLVRVALKNVLVGATAAVGPPRLGLPLTAATAAYPSIPTGTIDRCGPDAGCRHPCSRILITRYMPNEPTKGVSDPRQRLSRSRVKARCRVGPHSQPLVPERWG